MTVIGLDLWITVAYDHVRSFFSLYGVHSSLIYLDLGEK